VPGAPAQPDYLHKGFVTTNNEVSASEALRVGAGKLQRFLSSVQKRVQRVELQLASVARFTQRIAETENRKFTTN
jgi:hypothetical protein